ncbi:MAG: UPF0147 family protein [archaeon]
MTDETVRQILETLDDLNQDNMVPKNVKSKLGVVKGILDNEEEMSIKANRALSELEEVNDDPNLMPHTRTALYHIASMLETL